MSSPTEDLDRRFEGRAALDPLLQASGSLADTDDVVAAFRQAVKDGVPAAVVIPALWEDEPRFATPAEARRLFANLLGLYELVSAGGEVDAGTVHRPAKRARAPRPAPFGPEGPTDGFVEEAWRHLEDHPRERERLEHAFQHRQDALLSWLELQGLPDEALALAQGLLSEQFALAELGGHPCPALEPGALPADGAGLPPALERRLDEGVFEAEEHEGAPLDEAAGRQVRALVARAAAGWWRGP